MLSTSITPNPRSGHTRALVPILFWSCRDLGARKDETGSSYAIVAAINFRIRTWASVSSYVFRCFFSRDNLARRLKSGPLIVRVFSLPLHNRMAISNRFR